MTENYPGAICPRPVARGHCAIILQALKHHGPMGKTRIAQETGISDVAVARRLADLYNAGMAEPTGGAEVSKGGRAERVWRCVRMVL